MTRDELYERIDEQIIVHDGELKDYRWRQLDVFNDAKTLGWSEKNFFDEVNNRTNQLQTALAKLRELSTALQQKVLAEKRLPSDLDKGVLLLETDRLKLPRLLIEKQWLPAQLAKLPPLDAPPPAPAEPPPVLPPTPPPAEPIRVPEPTATAVPVNDAEQGIKQKIKDILDDYEQQIPAQAIRGLFRAIDYDRAALAELVKAYLQTNYYAAVSAPSGVALSDQLASTDWRHLGWWADGEKQADGPVQLPTLPTVSPTMPPPSAGPIDIHTATPPPTQTTPKRDNSVLYGVLFALVLAALAFFVLRPGSGRKEEVVPKPAAGHKPKSAKTPTSKTQSSASSANKPSKSKTPTPAAPKKIDDEATDVQANPTLEAPAKPKPTLSDETSPREAAPKATKDAYTSVVGKDYDRADAQPDSYGWRRARKNGKWGFVDASDRWVKEPEFSALTRFSGNKATGYLNGQIVTIQR